jgi:hypothetical protein
MVDGASAERLLGDLKRGIGVRTCTREGGT